MSDPESGSGRTGEGWAKGGGGWEEAPHTKSRVRGAAPGYLYAPLTECVVPALELGHQCCRRSGRRVPRSSGLVRLSSATPRTTPKPPTVSLRLGWVEAPASSMVLLRRTPPCFRR